MKNMIIIGDLNSNATWKDYPNKTQNHKNVFIELEYLNIISLYHKKYNEKQGEEKIKTHYNNKRHGSVHIDYCLISENLFNEYKKYLPIRLFNIKTIGHFA
jgi:endonuclease/exonuclease/phosphatase family metal-dependent hydrolase